jgi:hypothetical protein
MNPNLIDQIAAQHAAEVRAEAGHCRRPATADRGHQDSIRVRAGWTLINVGLRLTDPPAGGRQARPHPAGL